jgi:rod shape determining protein RodA
MARSIMLHSQQGFAHKILSLNWGLIILILIVSSIGFASLYAAAGGSLAPWASKQMVRFAIGFVGMLIVALIDIKWWFRLTWPLYFVGFVLLIIVEIMGRIGMGAQRWIDLGFMQIQPSELMKIAVIMALARYFHSATLDDMRRLTFLILPVLIILAPVGLVLLQPNLGTATMILIAGAGMLFIAGASIWLFILGICGVAAAVPVIWNFMHDYQRQRVLTFMNPESDPLGSGYNIIQSKIAIGSGGISGKGFLEGTQSRLNFLPEKQTDFIFTIWAEEQGLVGGLILLGLLGLMFLYGILISLHCRHNFSRYLALGLSINFSLYVFINIAMVMGLIPVVGVPLPLISYGGTSMMAALIGFGLMMSCNLHHDSKVSR